MNNTKADAIARLEEIITAHGYDFERDMEGLPLVRVYNYDYHYEVLIGLSEDAGRYSGNSTVLSARLSFSTSGPDEECLGSAFHDIRQMARLVQAINNPVITFGSEE